ncbi:MAG TPA: hypothetical protein VMP01_02860 [Pirellulaceae bacterium]|nr:hypothetical protein [Pirellulaceae bacterium]
MLLVVGLGFYRGWFSLSNPEADQGSNKVNIHLTVGPEQVKADAKAVQEKATELTGHATEGASKLGDMSKDGK